MTQPRLGRHRGASRFIPIVWPAWLIWALTSCASEPEPEPERAAATASAPTAVPATVPEAAAATGRPSFSVDGLADAPLCPGTSPRTEGLLSVSLRLIRGPGVSRADARVVGETIRTVWDRLGLRVQLTDPTALPDTTPDRLFDTTATTEDAQLAPLRAVLHAVPDGSSIAVVVMPRFVDGPSPLSAFRGLTVPVHGSAEAAASTSDAFVESNPHPWPVVFVNLAAGPRAPGDLSLSPAHEVGHALGLNHRSRDTALMSAGDLSLRCLAGLSPQEWQTLASESAHASTHPGL